jgi:hypothetical protein
VDAASELSKLAKEKFGELSEAEKELFRAVANGEVADYSSEDPKENDPADAAKWGPGRILKADRLIWLCTDRQALHTVTFRGIHITGARVDGEFDLSFAKVPFPLYFHCCKFTEEITFRSAQLTVLSMSRTHTDKIIADELKVRSSIYLYDGFRAKGGVSLAVAKIDGGLYCEDAQFINEGGAALHADGLTVGGAVFLRDGFRAEGEVRLLAAEIGPSLDCEGGQFINKGGIALNADGLTVGGAVFLRGGFRAEGEVRLLGGQVSGDLDCTKGQFINKGGEALYADGLAVKGVLTLGDGFRAEGRVRLHGAEVATSLQCVASQFINEGRIALSASGLTVGGTLSLRGGFKAIGRIDLVGARIGKLLSITGIDSPKSTVLDLRNVKTDVLGDDPKCWPALGGLFLQGMEFERFLQPFSMDSKGRIGCLRLQDGYWPQPYEQLAKVLRENGDGAGARDVLVAKNKDRAKRTELTLVEECWFRFLGPPIGYGHKPWLALPLALVIVLFGSVFFKEGYSHRLVTPLSDSAYTEDSAGTRYISEVYPAFHSFVYSMDVFVPVVNLRQAEYRLPNPNRGSVGWLLLFWLWFETACGWVLTTLFVVGLTGLVRT